MRKRCKAMIAGSWLQGAACLVPGVQRLSLPRFPFPGAADIRDTPAVFGRGTALAEEILRRCPIGTATRQPHNHFMRDALGFDVRDRPF